MSINIINESDTIEIKNITVMIIGQPGIGKTSLAFTARNPFLIGFDEYIYRPTNRKKAMLIENGWKDIINIKEEDLKPFDSIALDTVGMGVWHVSEYLMKTNPNTYKTSVGLSMSGWGTASKMLTDLFRTLKVQWKKDVIFVAHEREEKKKSEIIIRPDIPGGTSKEIYKMVDFVGYIYKDFNSQTMITFNSTNEINLKNPHLAMGTEPIPVPNFQTNPNFLAELMDKMKTTLNGANKRQAESVSKLMTFFDRISGITDVEGLNKIYKSMNNGESVGLSELEKKQIWAKIKEHAETLKCQWHREEKLFFVMNNNPAAEPTAPAIPQTNFDFE